MLFQRLSWNNLYNCTLHCICLELTYLLSISAVYVPLRCYTIYLRREQFFISCKLHNEGTILFWIHKREKVNRSFDLMSNAGHLVYSNGFWSQHQRRTASSIWISFRRWSWRYILVYSFTFSLVYASIYRISFLYDKKGNTFRCFECFLSSVSLLFCAFSSRLRRLYSVGLNLRSCNIEKRKNSMNIFVRVSKVFSYF